MRQSTCMNCNRKIEEVSDGIWAHATNGLQACSPFTFNQWAEPKENQN